jgi:hypothetical protein
MDKLLVKGKLNDYVCIKQVIVDSPKKDKGSAG